MSLSAYPATAKDWLQGARPHTWANAFAPVIAGTGAAAAADGAHFGRALLALVVAWALIVGVNFANDYSDGIRGTDDERVGPFRLTVSGLVPAALAQSGGAPSGPQRLDYPGKDPGLVLLGDRPLVAETPESLLDDDTTPTPRFFIRNNGQIPEEAKDADAWAIRIDGEVNRPLELTLGELKARDLDKEPKISGAMTVAQFNLREFLQGTGQQLPAMTDGNALNRAELVSRLSGTANSLALEELTLKLDDSTFTGRIAISDFARQALRVDLKGDRLNLDRYLPPPSKDEPAGAARKSEVKNTQAAAVGSGSTPLPNAPTQQAWSEASVLPLDQLRKLDSEVSLAIGSLTAMQLPLEGFNLKARARNGQLNLQELRGGLYGGRLDSSASLDVRQAQPLLTLQNRFNGVPIERLLESQGEEVVVKGLLNLDADLRTQGNSQKAWVDNLNGKVGFIIDNGVLVDANLEQQLCRAIATLNRKPLSSEPRSKDTPFRELKGNLTLRNGVASNPDLKASIPGLTVNGNGDVDLRVLGMDYRVGIVIEGDKGAMPDPACQVNERYVGIEWPLRCRGPLELGAKACRFDNDALGKIAARLAGERLNEKIEEKLGDKVSPELKDALKGLFKR